MENIQDVATQSLNELAALHQQYVVGIEKLNLDEENITIKRPWIDEPSGSVPFDEQNGITLGVIGVTTVVMSFTVDDGYDGVIKYLNNNVNFGGFVQFSGDLTWQLRINGKPVRNFQLVKNEKGTVQIPRPVSPIRIYSKDLVEWTVTHAANAGLAGQVICGINGYIYPSKGIS